MSLRDSAHEESSAVVDDLPISTISVGRRKSAMSLDAASAATFGGTTWTSIVQYFRSPIPP